jgi:hypothetical protein
LIAKRRAALLGLSLVLCGCAHLKSLPPGAALTPEERLAAIRRARVWSPPTEIPSLDLKAGPNANEAFAPNQWVTCEYKEKKLTGSSPKFVCESRACPGQLLYSAPFVEAPERTGVGGAGSPSAWSEACCAR